MFASCSVRGPVYCVELRAEDGDWIIVYLPLLADHRFDRRTAGPHLVKAMWGGTVVYGEFVVANGKYHRFLWGEGNPESLTDFAKRPIYRGETFRIFEADDPDGPSWEFVVKDVFRV